jgi:L-asparagine oxygenase
MSVEQGDDVPPPEIANHSLRSRIDVVSAIHADLIRDGFSFQPRFLPEFCTREVADFLGVVDDPSDALPKSGMRAVQNLIPRERGEVGLNRYSGNYGCGEFPLHTDLAHWAVPPRYFILRCLVGSEFVFTTLLAWRLITERIPIELLRRAVFRARKHKIGSSSLVRAYSTRNGHDLFRWDPLFLHPLNAAAESVASTMINFSSDTSVRRILLRNPSDTLIIDNWQSLHGRSAVSEVETRREVERVYLVEVHDQHYRDATSLVSRGSLQ